VKTSDTTINEQLQRVPTEHDVKCIECGHVGKALLPTSGDFNPEVKAWGEELVALSTAVTLDMVLEELMKPSTISGCDKGLALARDRIRCIRNPVAGVPDTAFAPEVSNAEDT